MREISREILFRGKLIASGEWAYGNLVIKTNGVSIITPDDTPLGKYGQVFPETVGQYTCLTDKNGNKIFEGDILKTSISCIFSVEWEKEGRFLGFTSERKIVYVNREPKAEVIGNINDNPELLEES